MIASDDTPDRADDDSGWDSAFDSAHARGTWDPKSPRATYEEQLEQTLTSDKPHRFLVPFAEWLTIFARSSYEPPGHFDPESQVAHLSAFNELMKEVLRQAAFAVHGYPVDAEALKSAILTFAPRAEFQIEWVIERALQSHGATCAYCGHWDTTNSRHCPRCGKLTRTMVGMAMDMLRTAQVEFSKPLDELDPTALATVRSELGTRKTGELVVVSDGEIPDDEVEAVDFKRWIYLLDRDSHDFYTVKIAPDGRSELEVTPLTDVERRESSGFLKRYDER